MIAKDQELISFADVAHGIITFNGSDKASKLILELIDTPWVQRLRRIRQTGNTLLVYMFAEHSRFGHSLGVAYLAHKLMAHLKKDHSESVEKFELAVSAAALLHDIGHVAPGSHLAERVWSKNSEKHTGKASHEQLSIRVVRENLEINQILKKYDPGLPELVARILSGDPTLPPWTVQIISGGGWNADRGNWTIVDSAMCAVSYGRYNVFALLDAYKLTAKDELVIQESRLDALTHFFVARDSMYRQIYQHRVLQAVDALSENIVRRVIELNKADAKSVFVDPVMSEAINSASYHSDLPLSSLFKMTEPWWGYHIEEWCNSSDKILSSLASSLRDRNLFKTVRVEEEDSELEARARKIATELGFDERYHVIKTSFADTHRSKSEELPQVELDSGKLRSISEVEPLIGELVARSSKRRVWLAMPKEIKEKLGRVR
jgi:HD superfamily phosphohydrolase